MRITPLLFLCLMGHPLHSENWTFDTPAGHTVCTSGADSAGADSGASLFCEIHNRAKRASIPQLEDCPLDRPIGVGMRNTGTATATCLTAEHQFFPGIFTYDYGTTETFDDFTCRFATQGLECRNADGHGFFLGRTSQRIF